MPTPDIDDPEAIAKFLAIVHTSSANTGPAAVQDAIPIPQAGATHQSEETSNVPAIIKSPSGFQDLAGSPENFQGTFAPPPTPATSASVQQQNGTKLEPIADDKDLEAIRETDSIHTSISSESISDDDTGTAALLALANKSTQNLSHSIHAPANRGRLANRLTSTQFPSKAMSAGPKSSVGTPEQTPKNELLEKMKALGAGSSFQDSIVEEFRRQRNEEEDKRMIKVEGGENEVEEVKEATKPQETVEPPVNEPEAQDPAFESSLTIASVDKKGVQEQTSESSVTAASVDDEDREHLTFFSSWGTATPRDRPKSRIRTVVLSNLPATADATLVASLIHGGTIETLNIAKPSETTPVTARVTFATGDSAEAYYAKYPNGIAFKFRGKKYTVFVDLGKEVDVISGLMRGYLESGASRVIRVMGAEEDWGIMALEKIASGKGRKVEAVMDTYREKTRIIIFRFTNIGDAVHFKAQLVRDDEWESCSIQFMEDPCEKATGVHLEDY